MQWYPLTFKPILKQKIWGGDRLNALKNLQSPVSKLGESWEISDVDDDISIVANGDFEGKSLKWLLELHGEQIMGKIAHEKFGAQFPLLIKYIDAAQDLSIQLHPSDDIAISKHNSFGKTEMWYVMSADSSAELILGFKDDCNEFAFAKAINDNNLPSLLNREVAAAGDSFLIKPGFVHAIGAGITLAEIQQSSDVTYRVFDYERVDDTGKQRELHVTESIAAADYSKAADYKLSYDSEISGRQHLAETNYFSTDILQFKGEHIVDLHQGKSFTILMNVGDECDLIHEGKNYPFLNSQTYLIPAAVENLSAKTDGNAKLLVVRL